MTDQLRRHFVIVQRVERAKKYLATGTIGVGYRGPFNHTLRGLRGVLTYSWDVFTVLTLGNEGNVTTTFLGSYSGYYKVVKIDKSHRTAILEFHVDNDSGARSGTRFPFVGYINNVKLPFGRKLNTVTLQDIVEKKEVGIPSGVLDDRPYVPI